MLGKNLISSVLTQIPVFILGVVSGVFSTRILGEEAKGAFAIFQANTQLFTLVFSLGIQTGIVYFISSKKITENRVAGMSICIFSFASILLLIIIFLGSSYNFTEVFLVKEFTSNLYLIVLYLLFLMTFFISIISSFFQAHSKFRIINFISIVNSVINAALFLFLFIYFQSKNLTANERFDYVLYGTLASLFINSSLWLYFQIKELKITPDFKFKFKNQFIPFISYNMVIYLGTFINFFNYRLDLWIVNQYLDKKNLSYYSLATNINQIILYVSVTIGTVMLPNLAKKNTEERIKTFSQISRFSFTFFIVLTVFAFFLSNFIIPFMYGEEFRNSIISFKILIPGILISSSTQLFATLMVASKENSVNIIATSAGLIFTILLDLILIPKYGINGAAIATSISYLIIFSITFSLFLRKLKFPLANYFIINKMDLNLIRETLKL